MTDQTELATASEHGRNLVILCDGTGNEHKARGNTNVVRLHSMVPEGPDQLCYYIPGVGTREASQALTPIGRVGTRLLGLAFGYGAKQNVVDGYRFLVRNWREGDRIYLFGFSRGAYIARALAGMLRVVGLLRGEQENLVPYALRLFWKGHGKDIDWEHVKHFTAQFSRPEFPKWAWPVAFIGVWDTVKAIGWFRRRLQLPYTRLLKSAAVVRHACSLDEWRSQYKVYTVSEDEMSKENRDFKEVWFAGVHSDVGGAYETSPELGQIAFQWLVQEAMSYGLAIDEEKFAPYVALPPSHAWAPLNRLSRWWLLLGPAPRRLVPAGATVHGSVLTRMGTSEQTAARYRSKGYVAGGPSEPWD
jgi:uncharacterized protein (DUF2235 family)